MDHLEIFSLQSNFQLGSQCTFCNAFTICIGEHMNPSGLSCEKKIILVFLVREKFAL